jgi:hypothetical protein
LHTKYLEDPAGSLGITDVTSAAYSSEFKPSTACVLNFGYTDSVYWVRCTAINDACPRISSAFLEENSG